MVNPDELEIGDRFSSGDGAWNWEVRNIQGDLFTFLALDGDLKGTSQTWARGIVAWESFDLLPPEAPW